MASPQTIALLRTVWASDVVPILEADLLRVMQALIHADTMDQVRALQGRGKALMSMLKLPEHLAAQSMVEDNGHGELDDTGRR